MLTGFGVLAEVGRDKGSREQTRAKLRLTAPPILIATVTDRQNSIQV